MSRCNGVTKSELQNGWCLYLYMDENDVDKIPYFLLGRNLVSGAGYGHIPLSDFNEDLTMPAQPWLDVRAVYIPHDITSLTDIEEHEMERYEHNE